MRTFLDTNILVYADDRDAGDKQALAQDVVRTSLADKSGVLSLQVLAEFFAVGTRKLNLDPAAARRRVELYTRLDVVTLASHDLLAAIDLTRLHSVALWDALILRAALIGGCQVLYSEDFQHGFRLEGLRVVNPFAP